MLSELFGVTYHACLMCCLQYSGDEAMHIILDHIKEGMDAVGKETPSHMTDFCGFCGSRRHTDDDTCPSCGKSQVIQLFFTVYYFYTSCNS